MSNSAKGCNHPVAPVLGYTCQVDSGGGRHIMVSEHLVTLDVGSRCSSVTYIEMTYIREKRKLKVTSDPYPLKFA